MANRRRAATLATTIGCTRRWTNVSGRRSATTAASGASIAVGTRVRERRWGWGFWLVELIVILAYVRLFRFQSEERGKDYGSGADVVVVPLRPAGSTPCVVQPDTRDVGGGHATYGDEEHGIYLAYYRFRRWVCVVDTAVVAKRDSGELQQCACIITIQYNGCGFMVAVTKAELRDTTEQEREFRRIYAAITHRMVHRKSMLDMYHRQGLNIFCEYRVGFRSRES